MDGIRTSDPTFWFLAPFFVYLVGMMVWIGVDQIRGRIRNEPCYRGKGCGRVLARLGSIKVD